MVTPAVDGIDLFKIAGRSISGWIPSLKTGITVRQPFCSQLEERLLMWLEYHPQVVSYARGDIGVMTVDLFGGPGLHPLSICRQQSAFGLARRPEQLDQPLRIWDLVFAAESKGED